MISNRLLFQLFHFVFVFINGKLIPSPFVKLNKPPFSNKLPVSIKHPPSPPPYGIEINKLPGGRGVLNRGFRVSRNHRNRHYNRIEETVSVFCIRPKVHVNLGEQQLPTIMPITTCMFIYLCVNHFKVMMGEIITCFFFLLANSPTLFCLVFMYIKHRKILSSHL